MKTHSRRHALPAFCFVLGLGGLSVFAASPVAAQEGGAAAIAATRPFLGDPDVESFIDEMAAKYGMDAATLHRDFALTAPNKAVLKAIAPPTRVEQRSWVRYRERFVNARRVGAGLTFMAEHARELEAAEARYGVPREIIAAIIGVETEYGVNPGRFKVFEALATLAFRYPPRAAYFRGELEQFLLFTRENGMDDLAVKGSYAGAIGIPQFMPSSLRRYAVDFDGNGQIDLRGSSKDAVGSVAAFLEAHGWRRGAAIALPVQVDAGQAQSLVDEGIRPQRSLSELAGRGVTVPASLLRPGQEAAESKAALVDLVSPEAPTEYWLGFDNFYVITRYNRSSFYAMSVFQLAEALRTGAVDGVPVTPRPIGAPATARAKPAAAAKSGSRGKRRAGG